MRESSSHDRLPAAISPEWREPPGKGRVLPLGQETTQCLSCAKTACAASTYTRLVQRPHAAEVRFGLVYRQDWPAFVRPTMRYRTTGRGASRPAAPGALPVLSPPAATDSPIFAAESSFDAHGLS